jgi:hypothetical protein
MFYRPKRERSKRGGWLRRGALGGAACAVALAAVLAGVAVPAARASSIPFFEMMEQASNGSLWSSGVSDAGDTGFPVMAGTTPSITQIGLGEYEAAWHASDGNLMVWGPSGLVDEGPMMAGTSPSITGLDGGGWEVAYVYPTGELITFGPADGTLVGWAEEASVAPGTSPSITGIWDGDGLYEAAYQGSDGDLTLVGNLSVGGLSLGLKAGTSPSIAALAGSTYQVAFQANTGSLWTVGADDVGHNLNLGMMAGTSPSITGFPTIPQPEDLTNNNFEIAFQANTGVLWTVGDPAAFSGGGPDNSGLDMMAGTSPSIASNPNANGLTGPEYETAFQANTGSLWTSGASVTGSWNLQMAPGTSPCIATTVF